ncbi:MAG: hypothetical protein Q8O67_22400 [Deltaproteobacteria bacterium]|nr:hypothetical protein [Deltaproteobacteria bacterium]
MTQLEAMALTWILELPIALLVSGRRDLRLVVVVVTATVLTHPFVWLIGTSLPAAWWWPGIFLTEGVVGVVEGLLLWRLVPLSFKRGLACGVAMNAFSFGVGLCL